MTNGAVAKKVMTAFERGSRTRQFDLQGGVLHLRSHNERLLQCLEDIGLGARNGNTLAGRLDAQPMLMENGQDLFEQNGCLLLLE